MGRNLLIILGVIAALLIFPVLTYNSLVTRAENVDSAWAQVENQLQRRADLIPNLVETVKGYTRHERELFTQIAEARSKLAGAQSVPQAAQAYNEVNSALSRLLVIVERYPDLKANQNYIQLMDELSGTENRIAVERKRYNESVRIYNRSIKTFPTVMLANTLGFTAKEYFQVQEGARAVPQVQFQ